MASGSWTFGTSNQYIQGMVQWSSTSNGSNANSSTVSVCVYFRRTNTGYTSYGTINTGVQCDTQTYWENNFSVTIQNSWVLTNARSYTVPHNTNGTKTCYIRATGNANFSLGSFDTSNIVTLDTIPRYANIKTFDVVSDSITQTSASFTWSTDAACDQLQYSLNGGSWTTAAEPESNNGSFSLSTLDPGISYSIKIRLKRKDSQLWKESNAKSFSTIPIATIINESIDFNIGEDLTIEFLNSENNKSFLRFEIQDENGEWEEISTTDETLPTEGTSFVWTLSTISSLLYSKVPTRNSAPIRICCGTTINGTVYGVTNYITGTMNVIDSDPTFTTFGLHNSDNSVSQIMGASDFIPQSYGNIQAYIDTNQKAVALNSANIMSYHAEVWLNTGTEYLHIARCDQDKMYSSTSQVAFDFGTFNDAGAYLVKIYAIDSRGNISSTVSKNFYVVGYHTPDVSIFLERQNSYEAQTILNITAYHSRLSVRGGDKNPSLSIKYRYAEKGTEYGDNYIVITDTTSTNISGNDKMVTYSTDTFVDLRDGSNKSFNFEFIISDALNTITITKTIDPGIPIMFMADTGHISVGMIPDVDNNDLLQMNSDITVTDNMGIRRHILEELDSLLDKIYPVGSIYMSVNNVDPSYFIGGTWERIKGKFLLGVDEDDTDFETAGLTGGEKEHTLTKAEVPNATGGITLHGAGSGGTAVQSVSGAFSAGSSKSGYSYNAVSAATSVGIINFNLGFGGGAHNNIPPYETVYIWKRTV